MSPGCSVSKAQEISKATQWNQNTVSPTPLPIFTLKWRNGEGVLPLQAILCHTSFYQPQSQRVTSLPSPATPRYPNTSFTKSAISITGVSKTSLILFLLGMSLDIVFVNVDLWLSMEWSLPTPISFSGLVSDEVKFSDLCQAWNIVLGGGQGCSKGAGMCCQAW